MGAHRVAAGRKEYPIDEAPEQSLSVYPVPASDAFTVSCYAPMVQAGTLVVTDITGQPVKQRTVTLHAGVNRIRFTTEGMRSGMYFIHGQFGGRIQVEKLLIRE